MPKSKKSKVRRYSVAWKTLTCAFPRTLTLHAANKKEAYKLVASQYPAQGKHIVKVLK